MTDGLDIPDFLRRGKGNTLPKSKASKKKTADRSAAAPVETPLPPLPEGLRWAATMAEEAGTKIREGVVPRRWAHQRDVVLIMARDIEERSLAKEAKLAEFRVAMAERKNIIAAAPPIKKKEFGADLRILVSPGSGRKEGTQAWVRFCQMKAYVLKNPRASVADVLRDTSYSHIDYKWDVAHGNIKIDVK